MLVQIPGGAGAIVCFVDRWVAGRRVVLVAGHAPRQCRAVLGIVGDGLTLQGTDGSGNGTDLARNVPLPAEPLGAEGA